MTDIHPASIIPEGSHVRTPQCPNCGFSVATAGQLCVVCQDKQDHKAPTPLWNLAPQQVPAYMRDAAPVQASDEDEDLDGDDSTTDKL